MKRFIRSASDLLDGAILRVMDSAAVPRAEASVYRVLLASYLLVLVRPRFSFMSEASPSMFNPPMLSVANLFDGFPPGSIFAALDLVLIASLLLVALGLFARIAGVVFFCAFVFGSSFVYSFGKIDHSFLVPCLALLCLSFSDWTSRHALRKDRPLGCHRGAFAVVAVVISFAMFTAGLEKLLNWIDFDLGTSGFLAWFYGGYFTLGRRDLAADMVFRFPPLLLEAMDYTAVLFECLPLVALLIGRRAWHLWLTCAIGFHMVNLLLLNIAFVGMPILYLAFLTRGLGSPASVRRFPPGDPRVWAGLAILWALASGVLVLLGRDASLSLIMGPTAWSYAALGIMLALMLVGLRSVWRSRGARSGEGA